MESVIESLASFVQQLAYEVRSQWKILKIIEQQVAQQAENAPRPTGQLPGQSEINPKGKGLLNAVTPRSGRELEDRLPKEHMQQASESTSLQEKK